MCQLSEMYWDTYLYDHTNTQNCYFFKNLGPGRVFGQNDRDIT